jgi:hypothetical protein
MEISGSVMIGASFSVRLLTPQSVFTPTLDQAACHCVKHNSG